MRTTITVDEHLLDEVRRRAAGRGGPSVDGPAGDSGRWSHDTGVIAASVASLLLDRGERRPTAQ